jgi:oxygen-independent coproporphyrinogen III oxidase
LIPVSALYLHIPFCLSKCPYCSFVSYPDLLEYMPRYVQALKKELAGIADAGVESALTSIFFGGGTPTVLKCELLLDLLAFCHDVLPIADVVEISVEANPGTVDRDCLARLRQAGVNRISFGIQTLIDRELKELGRRYSGEQAKRAIDDARGAGFDNISADLMYGIPGQSLDSWRQNLEQILSLRPEHLSCYQLSIDEGTPFGLLHTSGNLQLADEEEIEGMDLLTVELCRTAGLNQYEIANFAVPGRECRHNINYWRNGGYYAAGAGAVSCVEGRRARREADPRIYCRRIEETGMAIVDIEFLEKEASFRESVVMGLRMNEGVSRSALFDRYGLDITVYYGETLGLLQGNGLVELTPTHLRLSARGRRLANSVMAELV